MPIERKLCWFQLYKCGIYRKQRSYMYLIWSNLDSMSASSCLLDPLLFVDIHRNCWINYSKQTIFVVYNGIFILCIRLDKEINTIIMVMITRRKHIYPLATVLSCSQVSYKIPRNYIWLIIIWKSVKNYKFVKH